MGQAWKGNSTSGMLVLTEKCKSITFNSSILPMIVARKKQKQKQKRRQLTTKIVNKNSDTIHK